MEKAGALGEEGLAHKRVNAPMGGPTLPLQGRVTKCDSRGPEA